MMKMKFLKTLFIVTATAMMLTACGSAADPAVAGTDTVENVPGGAAQAEADEETAEETSEETEAVCEHEWKEATYSEPKTCAMCGETEGEPKQTYFEEHGIQVKDAPVDCTVDAVLYESSNNELQMITDVTWQQLDCYSELAQEDGYQLVHVELSASLQLYYNGAMNHNYIGSWISRGWYDWYTGRHFPSRSMFGDDAAEYIVTVDVDGVSYDVSYTNDVEWEQDEWIYNADGNAFSEMKAHSTYIFRIPEGYDGLVFAVIPKTECSEEDWDFETIDESERYALDDDYYTEGTVFFRINKEGFAPLRQVEE